VLQYQRLQQRLRIRAGIGTSGCQTALSCGSANPRDFATAICLWLPPPARARAEIQKKMKMS
jgi:hypothetical protein